jgi:hypothetical protein
MVIDNLAHALLTRFDLTGQQDDSDEATALQRELKGPELQTEPAEGNASTSTADRAVEDSEQDDLARWREETREAEVALRDA